MRIRRCSRGSAFRIQRYANSPPPIAGSGWIHQAIGYSRVVIPIAVSAMSPARSVSLWVLALGSVLPVASHADEASYWLMASPYTVHFRPSDEHRHVWLAGLERQTAKGDVAGVAFFTNSFGQPSVFAYPFGKTYAGPIKLGEVTLLPENWYAKWAGGLLYGYKGKYEDKVPFNKDGLSPGLILSLGRPITENTQFQANLLGANALMFQFNVRLK